MERNDETRGPRRKRPLDEPDESAERELSERAVEPHQPTYPPQVDEDEDVEREEPSLPDDRSTMERVNDALHRVRPRETESGNGSAGRA